MELYLESLQTKHLEQVVTLDQICLGGLWNLSGYQREIDSPNSTSLVFCLPSTDQIIGIGCFWAILEEAHITLLAIHPDYRRQGLGELLLINLLERAYLTQLQRATLEVKNSNKIAFSLYQKFGFKIAGIRRGYYEKTNEDALILWLSGMDKAEFFQMLEMKRDKLQKRLNEYQWNLVDCTEKS